MKKKVMLGLIAMVAIVAVVIFVGCIEKDQVSTPTATPSPTIASTATPSPTIAPTSMPTPILEENIEENKEKEDNLPTYSDVLKTYPDSAELCTSEAYITDVKYVEGQCLWHFEVGPGGIEIVDGAIRDKWYGTKITLKPNLP